MQNAQTLVLETINGLIEENQIEKALDTFKDLDKQSEAGIWQDITLQYSRYRSALQAQNQGRISFSEFSMIENQIKYALTELMKTVPRRLELNAKIRSVQTFEFEVPDKPNLEKLLGTKSNLVTVDWLEKARVAANAVCRVVSGEDVGTGFLTKDGYVFTNNHVIRSLEAAKSARLEFNFELGKTVTSYQVDASDFKSSPPDQLDFARVKVIDRSDAPLSKWGFVEFDTESLPLTGEDVTIIQHPLGDVKKFKSDEVLGQVNQYLFYTTETEPGSSGSPVLNKDCKVIALHHAGKTMAEGGLVINANGTKAGANRGILFRDIFAFIGK
ncbi:MAG: trypsin-like peptidase domain-containing protein [Phycisphaerae bacterium]|nr:trypsin-like peptidase domain-containing protein [Saprospiraceae bacterium]